MNIIKAVILGIIEGITEWMPVSSTAHLTIFNMFLNIFVSEEFYEVFEVVIQLGAILALLLLFWKKVFPFGKSKNPLGSGVLSLVKKDKFILWIKLFIACLPAIIYELLLDDVIKFVTNENKMIIIAISLILVGFVFILVEGLIKNKEAVITSTRGVSRSGATIIAALLLGISRTTAVEFTFELAIPVMVGASLMKIIKYPLAMTFGNIMVLLFGCISAFIVSLFMIRFVMDYIKKNTFTLFGIYRILLGIIILLFLK